MARKRMIDILNQFWPEVITLPKMPYVWLCDKWSIMLHTGGWTGQL